eukprot:CAMPEP_0179350056 /NCGR_PEP_ID=MMETSP0797-20121207/74558_1 /TAXON_ID=47934 /ORGANISM="Dinophysis acuminata, Strain DAEP01" /LENGTH=235 /DNA_ID=CAMNT_0021064955 /DNA_START=176 /DNA_END=881 /DNA_ORIENTATION=+
MKKSLVLDRQLGERPRSVRQLLGPELADLPDAAADIAEKVSLFMTPAAYSVPHNLGRPGRATARKPTQGLQGSSARNWPILRIAADAIAAISGLWFTESVAQAHAMLAMRGGVNSERLLREDAESASISGSWTMPSLAKAHAVQAGPSAPTRPGCVNQRSLRPRKARQVAHAELTEALNGSRGERSQKRLVDEGDLRESPYRVHQVHRVAGVGPPPQGRHEGADERHDRGHVQGL